VKLIRDTWKQQLENTPILVDRQGKNFLFLEISLPLLIFG
jgi:hypothetical protein